MQAADCLLQSVWPCTRLQVILNVSFSFFPISNARFHFLIASVFCHFDLMFLVFPGQFCFFLFAQLLLLRTDLSANADQGLMDFVLICSCV